MYIINTTIEVNWVIPAMVVPMPLSDFDIRIRDPEGNTVILEEAIAIEDYILPTDQTAGGVSYPFTPDALGIWLVVLVANSFTANPLYFEYYLEVHKNDTHIYQQVRL